MRSVVLAASIVLVTATTAGAALVPDNNGRMTWVSDAGAQRVVARKHHSAKKRVVRERRPVDASGNAARTKSPPWNMVRVRTTQGFYITVHPAYAHKFLRLFELLAQNGVKVPPGMVGCYSRGGHVRGSNHYIGAACDIQTGWNRTIPAMYRAGKWIRAAGLYDGCAFGDCGHVEAVRGTHNRAPNLYASVEKFRTMQSTANYQP